MDDKEQTLKGKGLEIGRFDDQPVLLGSLAARSMMASEHDSLEGTLKGKGTRITDKFDVGVADEAKVLQYRSVKNGDSYVVADGPVKEGLIRLRNVRNDSIVTLSLDAIRDPDRFVVEDYA